MRTHRTLSESWIDENIEVAEALFRKWDSSPATGDSLFFSDREDSKQYLKSVKDLQAAMRFLASEHKSSEKFAQANSLMQTAVKRLEKEFYQILSKSEMSGFASELEDDVEEKGHFPATAMEDLKSIADCMISAGHGRECAKIYNICRKSVVDEGLHRLGVERLSFHQVHHMDWDVVEKKIKIWLQAVKAAVRTLFEGERMLCNSVFSSSAPLRESCFREISKDAAMTLFGFPESVAKCKKTPEKIFSTLNIYEVIDDLRPVIESVFSFESTAGIRSQVSRLLIKLGEGVRAMLSDFETAMQKDSTNTPAPNGGVHPLTRYVMNYISFLSDYSGILADIVADGPLTLHSQLPESYLKSLESDESPIAVRLAWLVLVLLCKIDVKAQLYNDVALSYIFLANNLHYVVSKVRSSNLKFMFGDEWIAEHESKVKQYSSNYERIGWNKVFSSLPENPTAWVSPETAREHFSRFNDAFEETYRRQTSWVIADQKLRDEIRVSLGKKLGFVYGIFYETHQELGNGSGSVAGVSPDDIGNYLSDLFYGAGFSGSVSSSSSSSSSSHFRRLLHH